jgi:hypothetical protein
VLLVAMVHGRLQQLVYRFFVVGRVDRIIFRQAMAIFMSLFAAEILSLSTVYGLSGLPTRRW